MRIHIYYGGRGLIEDPNLYVLKKIEEVFEELRVKVERFNLFEDTTPYSSWCGGFYYDIKSKDICGWSRYDFECYKSIEITLNDGNTLYMHLDGYTQTKEVKNWWDNHENDRTSILEKLIIESML